jgi:transcriptional regulator with XRE-family HTH domain
MDEGAPMPPERSSRPFTELLDRAITEQSFSLTQVARRVDQAAAEDNQRLATTKQQVYRWRHGPQVPEPQVVRWIATALERPVEEFATAAHQQRQLLRGRAHPQPSPAGSARTAPAELPHDVADFTGRSDELAELRARVFSSEGAYGAVLTIDGAPGIGKSALAVHLAHQVREQFPDAQLFANLRGERARDSTHSWSSTSSSARWARPVRSFPRPLMQPPAPIAAGWPGRGRWSCWITP